MNTKKVYPELETQRLILREMNVNDAEFVFKHFSNEKVCEYLYDEDVFTSIDEALELIESNSDPEGKKHNRWGIVRKKDNSLIDTCGFQNMSLNRIQAYVALENDNSAGLLEKMGFKKEGVIREKHLFKGKYYDHYCYSLLRREVY